LDDVRQNGYSRNEAQVVDAVAATRLFDAGQTLAAASVQELANLLPCSDETDGCARQFIEAFAAKAYRRPPTADEVERLVRVFEVGAEQGFGEGVGLVISAVLQSPSFLYHFELGDASEENPRTRLTAHETASLLSYFLTGGPPDTVLMASANDQSLFEPDVRVRQAQRLLDLPGARAQVELMVTEWLTIDSLRNKGKEAKVYPDFLDYRSAMVDESRAFVSEVLWNGDGSLTTLLTADFTRGDEVMASFYGVPFGGEGLMSWRTIERRGLLNQASWLATTAHGDDSGPVTRGLGLLRRVLCASVPGHAQMGVAAPFPPNDFFTSSRERIAAHSQVPACATCHGIIDDVGFLFENYDGMGRLREEDNGVPVDTSGSLSNAVSQWGVENTSGTFANSQDLIAVLGQSPDVRDCFARNVVRFASATRVKDVEDRLLRGFSSWPADKRDRVLEQFIQVVRDDAFIYRSFNPPLETLEY
jgi:hypothetical protein